MGLDIGQALREGASRTAAKNGLILAAVFAGIALLTTVLFQTLSVAFIEAALEAFQNASPQDMGIGQTEYEQAIAELETTAENVRETSPLALGLSASAAVGGLVTLALLGEAVSIVAVRVFATGDAETVTRDLLSENIVFATLNGFVGAIVVWILVIIGAIFLLLPGIALAVLFYFLRQEIAIKNKNFVQAMADSWRITKGHRIEVFLIGFVLVVVSQLELLTSAAVSVVSTAAGAVAAAAVGGLLSAFGAAVVTRAYVQIDDGSAAVDDEPEEEDPYAAALGPDDLPR